MRRIYGVIFLVSSAVLVFEISLTRLFSIYLWYHFAFLVISIAMLGIGSAGTVLAIRHRNIRTDRYIPFYAVLAGVSIALSYIISNYIPFDPVKFSWERIQILYVALYCLVLSIPFFFSGILIASAFTLFSERSGPIYCSDLTGAGAGSMMVILLLNTAGPEYAVLTASVLCLMGAILSGGNQTSGRLVRPLSATFIMINLLMLVLHPDFIDVRISPYKPLSLYLKYPEAEHLKTYHSPYARIDTFRSPAVRFAPGLSLRYQDPLPEQVGIAVDGDRIEAITGVTETSKLKFLEFLPSALIYVIGKTDDVLVLEPGGGLQVLVAEYHGAENIHKIESNPLLVKVIRDDFGSFSGGIFEDNTITSLGRNHIGTPDSYDVIDISMTGATVAGVFGISEDYRFTVEAFETYLKALRPEGIMGISLYLLPPPRTEFRVLTTVITALERTGIENVAGHVAAIRSWDTMTVLVKKTPFTFQEIEAIKEFSRSRWFDLVYYPGMKEGEGNRYIRLPSDEYFRGFSRLLDQQSRSVFIRDYLFDIRPVYDENPFFHYFLRLKKIKEIYRIMGQKWMYFLEEGYLLPVIFVIVLILGLIMIILPALSGSIRKRETASHRTMILPTVVYFAMLGIGFMSVEVTLIQKSILLLENPAYAVTVILTAILISSGIGSIISSRLNWLRTPYSLFMLTILILLYSIMYPLLQNMISSWMPGLKALVIFIFFIPLGFFMGIPFPMGIRLIGQRQGMLIPWAWATNACLSVLAPVVTIMLAIVTGYRMVLWLAALAYLVAFVAVRRLRE